MGYHPDAFWVVEELEHKVEKLKSDKDAASGKTSQNGVSVNNDSDQAKSKKDAAKKVAVIDALKGLS